MIRIMRKVFLVEFIQPQDENVELKHKLWLKLVLLYSLGIGP